MTQRCHLLHSSWWGPLRLLLPQHRRRADKDHREEPQVASKSQTMLLQGLAVLTLAGHKDGVEALGFHQEVMGTLQKTVWGLVRRSGT